MITAYVAPTLSAVFRQFKQIIGDECVGGGGRPIVVFCEDRLSLVAEKALCDAVGGSFTASVYTLSRFLVAERGRAENVLSSQGSAMVLRSIIDDNAAKLNLLKRLSATGAAQQVYDTIALLYSSGVSAEDIAAVQTQNELLRRKLSDLSLLYSLYTKYLDEKGFTDRNAYLRRLPEVISSSSKVKGAHVIILGFQAFTSSVRECVRACMGAADGVSGLFIGGRESYYVNQAWTSFVGIASECGKSAQIVNLPSDRGEKAEHLRKNIFDTMAFHRAGAMAAGEDVSVTIASDEGAECDFIASRIAALIDGGGLRYREISVMLPDMAAYQPLVERAFRAYGIPMYADRRYPLISHPVCAFLLGYLHCLADGCRPDSVTEVVSSPLFLAAVGGENARADKDAFVNYLLRAASSVGGVKREINAAICSQSGLDYEGVCRIRSTFLRGLELLSADRGDLAAGLKKLAEDFKAEETLEAGQEALADYPSVAAMNARVYEGAMGVLEEAEKLTSGRNLSVRRLAAILKSGFTAAEISLIPPKQDAVFVGDLSATANTGSQYVFAAGLTEGVPASSQDTAILTDSELISLEELHLAVSPKISEVNDRVREIAALNMCAFSKGLHLVCPLRRGGEESVPGELVDYVCRLFSSNGEKLVPLPAEYGDGNFIRRPEYFSRPLPALARLAAYMRGQRTPSDEAHAKSRDMAIEKYSAVYRALGDWARAQDDKYILSALSSVEGYTSSKPLLADGRAVYGTYLSPTTLEEYFSCPYRCFMSRGLRLAERAEGALRPLDSGNFIHAVLERSARAIDGFSGEEDCARYARGAAEELLALPEYAAVRADKRGEYVAKALEEDAVKVAVGAYRQISNSLFKVEDVEKECSISLGEITLRGRIDRVDDSDGMVRIIDYKTGSPDDSAAAYYMGLDTQLPLYLKAASEGRRPAGAYYFPANAEYSADGCGNFTLSGFMDGSEDVVRSSDINVAEKEKSAYVNAYLKGRALDTAMSKEDFSDFLDYSVMVTGGGAEEMYGGNISPSPVMDACEYCKFAGCCGYDLKRFGERPKIKVSCRRIAEISRNCKEEQDGKD